MIKKLLTIGVTIAVLNANSLISKVEKDLVQSVVPNTKIEKIKHTAIDGLYEVFMKNGQLFYVYPYKRLLLFGEIYTNTGMNLTNNDRVKWANEVNKKLLTKMNAKELTKDAFKLNFGKGANRYAIVLFTDPECPFCRKVDKYLEEEKPNTSFYVNYMPLYFHPHAHKWALQILSSKDKLKAIKSIEKTNKDLNVKITKEAKETLKNTQALAKKLNINGTPTMFVIDTKTNKVVDKINGANIPKIQKWIKKDKNEK
jgi:thiol:disulfide interchange protein DsbC